MRALFDGLVVLGLLMGAVCLAMVGLGIVASLLSLLSRQRRQSPTATPVAGAAVPPVTWPGAKRRTMSQGMSNLLRELYHDDPRWGRDLDGRQFTTVDEFLASLGEHRGSRR